MIVWRGWGILVLVLGAAALLIGQSMLGGKTANELSMMGVFLGRSLPLLLAAVPVWIIGTRLNRKAEKVLFDKEKNEDVVLRSGGGHSFFFIPMQYWGQIFVALAIVAPFLM